MELKQEALHFVEKLAELYFEKRDLNALLATMDEDTSWLGTGQSEFSRNLVEATSALTKEFGEYSGSFNIVKQELYASELSESVCVVYGLIQAVPEMAVVEEQNLHLTIVCIKSKDGIRLAHCNVSRSDIMQGDNTSYLEPQVRYDNKKLRGTLISQEHLLKNLTHNIPGGVHQCLNDPNLTIISLSDSFIEMFGYTQEEIKTQFSNKFINMIYPNDRALMLKTIHEQLASSDTVELEYRVMRKNGELVWILDKGRLLVDEFGKNCFYCILIEITERKKEQEKLRLSLERHQIIMDQAADIIFEWDIASDKLEFSANWRKKFGYDPISSNISGRIPLSENIYPDDIWAFVKIMQDMAAGVPYSETEFRIRDLSGQFFWNRIRATAQFDQNGRAIKAVGIIADISAEKEEKLALIEQAQKDALTGLYNKATIKILVEKCLKESTSDSMHALLIIDVDHFKQVNDTYGHLCGDTLLSDVAQLLKNNFRSTDLIGRIGGDEFLVYMPNVHDEKLVRNKVELMLESLIKVQPTHDAPSITCSVGAAVLAAKDIAYYTLYHAADKALYKRKNEGRNGLSFYDPLLSESEFSDGLAHSAVNDYIDSEECSVVEEKLSQYVFRMLYQSIDVETAVNRLLEIVGRAYNVSRVYIFESTEDGLACNNTFEWCGSNIVSEIDTLQGIRYNEDLGGYLSNFDQDGVFYCRDITTLHPSLYKILAFQGIRSLLQCAILNKGQFEGYVGFDECKENCSWSKEQVRSLTLIANVLSVFLVKFRLEEQAEKHSK